MVRAIWSGSVSFGLVNVPVKVVSAVQSKDVRFHMLHGEDNARIELKRVCSVEGEEVPNDQIVKGFEVSPGKHVILSKEELDSVDPEATRAIDILDFVQLSQVDPLYFERPYYLVPDKGAEKPYRLLVEAMERTGRVGIARVVLRSKEHLVALRPVEGALTMTTLVYHDELVSRQALDIAAPRSAPNEREVEMAAQLVDALATDFEPERYHDVHRERVMDLIEKKAQGGPVELPKPGGPRTPPADLVSALQASLEAARRKGQVEA